MSYRNSPTKLKNRGTLNKLSSTLDGPGRKSFAMKSFPRVTPRCCAESFSFSIAFPSLWSFSRFTIRIPS